MSHFVSVFISLVHLPQTCTYFNTCAHTYIYILIHTHTHANHQQVFSLPLPRSLNFPISLFHLVTDLAFGLLLFILPLLFNLLIRLFLCLLNNLLIVFFFPYICPPLYGVPSCKYFSYSNVKTFPFIFDYYDIFVRVICSKSMFLTHITERERLTS